MTMLEELPPTTGSTRSVEANPTNRRLLGMVMVLAVALAGLGAWLLVEQVTDGDVDSVEIVDQWAEAFLAGDAEGVASLFTEDGVYEERGPTQLFEGHEAIRRQLEEGFRYGDATEMTPDTITTGDGLLPGRSDVIVVDWTMSGMSAPGSRLPTDKTPFSVQAITLFEMDGDLINRSVFYASWDEMFN